MRLQHSCASQGPSADDHDIPRIGEVDGPRVLGLLRDNGFRGLIMMEIMGHAEPVQILDAARRARQFLRRTVSGLNSV